MIKRYNDFLNEKNQNFEPITIKSKKNDLFFIKIHFDDNGKVDKIENKWDIKLPSWTGLKLNQIEVNNWISKRPEFYIEKLNENVKFAFQDDIKSELEKLLNTTVWGKVEQTGERAEELMNIHKKFIELASDKMSAEEIARRLFEYEKNILNR